MDFDAWLAQVDALFENHYGFHHDDVEDWLWHDSFRAGDTPQVAFEDWEAEQRRWL
jgi:hypothetical protein